MKKRYWIIIGLAAVAAAAAPKRNRLIVHEWGTFTSIAGDDGLALEWRPLAGESDLPGFVYDIADLHNATGIRHRSWGKQDMSALVRMETPVIYFYSDIETDVSVRVDFPKGTITEWYPRARSAGASIDWGRIKIVRDFPANFPIEKERSHYYAARETDASPIRVCSDAGTQFEKFLFYRGVGSFEPPLAVTLDSEKVRVKNLGAEPVGEIILFENRNGQLGYRIHLVDSGETVVARPVGGGNLEALFAEFEKALVSRGLYAKEAKAMLETWRDSWFEEGLRVFYIMPRQITDAVLPLTLAPAPDRLVRVLVGRIEIVTPETEARVLADPRSYGRFAEPILKRVAGRAKSRMTGS